MNVFAMEELMRQQKSEIEKAALASWQWSPESGMKLSLFELIRKFDLLNRKTVQVQPTACCTCSC